MRFWGEIAADCGRLQRAAPRTFRRCVYPIINRANPCRQRRGMARQEESALTQPHATQVSPPRRSRRARHFPRGHFPATLALLILLLPSAAASAEGSSQKSERSAVLIAEQVLTAMGGDEAWKSTRFIRFEFFGFRLHHWDRHTGRHRMEGKTREGVEYVVLHDINDRGENASASKVWLDGKLADGSSKKEWLNRAYRGWINDTYWLIMPYKLRDPGVNLEHEGEETLDGVVYDKLRLTFDGVGVTPGDTYWAYINRETGLMDRWAYHLEGWEEERPATQWKWLDWDRYGRIVLSPRRVNLESGSEQELGRLAVYDTLPDSVFASPDPVEVD